MEAKKLVAVFLMCMVVFSCVHISKADETLSDIASEYTVCFKDCQKACSDEGFGYTHCEMKCDSDCSLKMLKDRIQKMKN